MWIKGTVTLAGKMLLLIYKIVTRAVKASKLCSAITDGKIINKWLKIHQNAIHFFFVLFSACVGGIREKREGENGEKGLPKHIRNWLPNFI